MTEPTVPRMIVGAEACLLSSPEKHMSTTPQRFPLRICILTLGLVLAHRACPAVPTPRLDEGAMLGMCDVAATGRVASVKLLRRWIGDRPGIDVGYEHGVFECVLAVEKPLKGDVVAGGTVTYLVDAYMEGLWDAPPPRGFVYEGTNAAVRPGTKLTVYLSLGPDGKEYRRVHFNSGLEIIEPSPAPFPTEPGRTATAD